MSTLFVYNAAGQMVAEYTVNGQATTNGTSYLTADSLGTPRVITAADGSVRSRHDYFPFGEEISTNIGGRVQQQGYGVSDNVRQKFGKSYERDTETGLDYAKARYYGSMMGRFISVDPAMGSAKPSRPQSWNRYSYCLNNPLNFIDPTGMRWAQQYNEDDKKWGIAQI